MFTDKLDKYGSNFEIDARLRADQAKFENVNVENRGKKYRLHQVYDLAINDRPGSRLALVYYYFHGKHVDRDRDFAMSILRSEIAISEDEEHRQLCCFMYGGYHQELGAFDKAAEVFSSPHLADYPPAISRLGLIKSEGQSQAVNLKGSEYYFKKAAKTGHIRSKILLARFYISNGSLAKKIKGILLLPYALIQAVFSAALDPYNRDQMP